jgi:hypothetical protein
MNEPAHSAGQPPVPSITMSKRPITESNIVSDAAENGARRHSVGALAAPLARTRVLSGSAPAKRNGTQYKSGPRSPSASISPVHAELADPGSPYQRARRAEPKRGSTGRSS